MTPPSFAKLDGSLWLRGRRGGHFGYNALNATALEAEPCSSSSTQLEVLDLLPIHD